jgi:integrase
VSKALQDEIDKLFEATKDLMSFAEIKPHCDRFNEWLNEQKYKESTKGTKLSKYGFFEKFKSLELIQDKNAEAIAKHDDKGNVTGTELKHYAVVLCGLSKEQWNKRNKTTRVIERLENSTEIDPDTYLEVTGKLLASEDPHELAVGLIAATGRRPHEIIARAKFTAIKDKPHHVVFEGQGKKRGQKPTIEIPTLYPANYVIKALDRLRKEPNTQALIKEVTAQFPKSETRQNVEIDNRRGQSLRRVVRDYFGDKGEETPVLAFRHGDEQGNNKALRAAYAVLATERDIVGGYGAKILYASRILGHYTPEKEDDRELVKIATSVGYSDYYITKSVCFPPAPQKGKLIIVRALEKDFETIKELQAEWELPNQQAVISRLIESHQQKVDVAKELLEAKSRIAQLEKQVNQLQERNNQLEQEATNMEPQQITHNATDLESLIAQEVERQLQQALDKMPAVQATPQPEEPVARVSQPTRHAVITREKELTDWEGKTNEELWTSKASGAANEKIRRSFEAICAYNDTVATGDDDRLAITNQGLRELSGVNGWLVRDWIKSHADEIINHNNKHGMQPIDKATGELARDKENNVRTDSYYNKRHGKEKIEELLKRVNKEFLDGQAKV